MKWFIRRVIKKGKGSLQFEEEIHFGETLTIGRAANQAIFINDLRAALEHARVIALGNGRYRIESLVAAGLRIDDRFEHTATATAGSTIEIGNVRITLVDPPADFEAAVEVGLVDKAEVAAREQVEALPQSLTEAGLRKRSWSWAFLLIALTFGLAVPLMAHFVPTFRALSKDVPKNVSSAMPAQRRMRIQSDIRCLISPRHTARIVTAITMATLAWFALIKNYAVIATKTSVSG